MCDRFYFTLYAYQFSIDYYFDVQINKAKPLLEMTSISEIRIEQSLIEKNNADFLEGYNYSWRIIYCFR